jgi:hypothetical protein
MSISFLCPKCQKAYTVKDELTGKQVVCKICENRIRVPAAGGSQGTPAPEVESLAVAALADEPAAVAEATATFEAECPNCLESVTWDAKVAGKQAPCPNCRRIVRVPVPAAGKLKDWRVADHRPTLAKQAIDPSLEGAWGNTTSTSVVSRDALVEAEAIRDRRRQPTSPRQKLFYAVIGACLAALAVVGGLLFTSRRTEGIRADHLQKALKLVADNKALPAGARAEVYRAAGEYRLRQPESNADEAHKHLKEAMGAAAFPPGASPEQQIEHTALLTEIALTLTDLAGAPDQVRGGERMAWGKVQPELRRTLQPLATLDMGPREGAMLALQRLTRKVGLRGEGSQAAMPSLAHIFAGDAKAEALAAVGLELLGRGEAEQKKAEELAAQAKGLVPPGGAGPPARVVALHVALKQPQAFPAVSEPAGAPPSPLARMAYAEGYARRGEFDKARAIAAMPGRFEDRFQALVTVAAVAVEAGGDAQDLSSAVELFENELKTRDLPDWPLIRLAQACARATQSDAGPRLSGFLAKLSNLSPRSQAVRAWAMMELLRSPAAKSTEDAVKAIEPATALGHLLAWEELARRTAPADLGAWPAPARALGYAGAALGMLDKTK